MSETLNWSNVVKQQPAAPLPSQNQSNAAAALLRNQLQNGCKSDKGIVVAVVDANAIIQGGDKLAQSASKFVSVPEFRSEVRDPVSRRKLDFLPFEVKTMNPTPESLRTVINFARETGDLQTLSDVDLKLIALTHTLEEQLHGTERVRKCPPPIHVVKAKSLPVKELPGWGSNVPNLEEWEALEPDEDEGVVQSSRILPIMELELDGRDENGSEVSNCEIQQNVQEPTVEKAKVNAGRNTAVGVDASMGQSGDDGIGDSGWLPAVSRSTHRRFLRRKARRETIKGSSEFDIDEDNEDKSEELIGSEISPLESECTQTEVQGDNKAVNGEGELSSILEDLRLEEEKVNLLEQNVDEVQEEEEEAVEENDNSFPQSDVISQISETVDLSFTDDNSSEQSWMLKSLSDSTVACITSDFAMQNVLIQMGLRLLAPGGMQIRQLKRWVLKCHACYEVTKEAGRIFCPKCGNGGTLRKVAVTVGENGVVLSDRKQRISIRGTRFSLPMPQSGRDAITKNPVLREDQLSHKLLYPKTKKKPINEGDDLFLADDIFHHSEKRAPLKPPVGKAVSVFIGRKNPNDNHNTRARRRS